MVYMILRQLKTLTAEMDIAPVFPVIGYCFLYCPIGHVPIRTIQDSSMSPDYHFS